MSELNQTNSHAQVIELHHFGPSHLHQDTPTNLHGEHSQQLWCCFPPSSTKSMHSVLPEANIHHIWKYNSLHLGVWMQILLMHGSPAWGDHICQGVWCAFALPYPDLERLLQFPITYWQYFSIFSAFWSMPSRYWFKSKLSFSCIGPRLLGWQSLPNFRWGADRWRAGWVHTELLSFWVAAK